MRKILHIFLVPIFFVCFLSCQTEEQREDIEKEARSLFKQGQAAYAAGQPDSALTYFSIVGSKLATSAKPELLNLAGESYNTCGVIYFLKGDFPESVNSFLTAEQIGDDVIKARVYNNIASIFHYFNDNEKAMEYLERAAQDAQKTGEWDVLRSSTLNMLNYCFEVNETGRAVAVMERLLNSPIPDDDQSKYVLQTGLGMRAATKDSLREAKQYFKNAIEVASRLNDADRYRMMSYNHLSRTLMMEGKYEEAIACLDTVADICGGEKQADTFMALCELKADCYKGLGDKQAEYEARLKYVSLKDSLFSAKEFGKVLELQSARKIDRVEKNLVSEKELRINRERLAWGLVIIVILISCVVVWIWLQNKRLRDVLRVLYEKTKSPLQQDVQKATLNNTQNQTYAETPDANAEQAAQKFVIDDGQAGTLADDIVRVMIEQKPYLTPSFSIKDLADLTGSNTKYVSYALNKVLGSTFPSFVNSYRVQEACARLRDEAHKREFTIESIANGVGFKSRTSFNAIFKKITGLTPKEYILMAKGDKD